jgi:hypothetical protein
MPELNKDATSLGMHGIRHQAPRRDLLGAMDAGRSWIPLALGRDVRSLGHDEPGRGALLIVERRQGDRLVPLAGAVTSHRRHDDPVRQANAAKIEMIE